jgi:hypothetical protein
VKLFPHSLIPSQQQQLHFHSLLPSPTSKLHHRDILQCQALIDYFRLNAYRNPFMKRRSDSEIECPIEKRGGNILQTKKSEVISVKRSLELLLEIERCSKKIKLESNYKLNEIASTKKCLNPDDASVTFKKVKLACSDAGTQKSHITIGMHLLQISRFTIRV